MERLTLEIAMALVNNKQAGFYACQCQSPIAHEERTCVFADGEWYLLEASEFLLIDHGLATSTIPPAGMAWKRSGWYRKIELKAPRDHPIVQKLLLDEKRSRGPDIPVPLQSLYTALTVESNLNAQEKERQRKKDQGPT